MPAAGGKPPCEPRATHRGCEVLQAPCYRHGAHERRPHSRANCRGQLSSMCKGRDDEHAPIRSPVLQGWALRRVARVYCIAPTPTHRTHRAPRHFRRSPRSCPPLLSLHGVGCTGRSAARGANTPTGSGGSCRRHPLGYTRSEDRRVLRTSTMQSGWVSYCTSQVSSFYFMHPCGPMPKRCWSRPSRSLAFGNSPLQNLSKQSLPWYTTRGEAPVGSAATNTGHLVASTSTIAHTQWGYAAGCNSSLELRNKSHAHKVFFAYSVVLVPTTLCNNLLAKMRCANSAGTSQRHQHAAVGGRRTAVKVNKGDICRGGAPTMMVLGDNHLTQGGAARPGVRPTSCCAHCRCGRPSASPRTRQTSNRRKLGRSSSSSTSSSSPAKGGGPSSIGASC